jgi:hypothetical protein
LTFANLLAQPFALTSFLHQGNKLKLVLNWECTTHASLMVQAWDFHVGWGKAKS